MPDAMTKQQLLDALRESGGHRSSTTALAL